jgi:hypothetical protein
MDDPVLLDDDQFSNSLQSADNSNTSVTNSRDEEESSRSVSFINEIRNKGTKPQKRKTDVVQQSLELERKKVQLLEEHFTGKIRKVDDEDYLFLMSLLPQSSNWI